MSDIQQARDVLAEWRETSADAWSIGDNPLMPAIVDESGTGFAWTDEATTARLIVGTAGNRELLDAIDIELSLAVQFPEAHNTMAKRLAAAIIAADERMNA